MRFALRPVALSLAAVLGVGLLIVATPAASAQAAAPTLSTSHYVRTVTGAFADPSHNGEGCTDAQQSSTFALLDIGAQLNDGTGVELSATHTRVSYADLRTAINGYTASFASCRVRGQFTTIAVGTNNDGSFTAFSGSNRGRGWADHVIDRLAQHAGLSIVGAIDIEVSFRSTEAQAEAWESAYLAATTGVLIFNGAASGCPNTPGVTKRSCAPVRDEARVLKTWTQAQYYRLAHALSPTRIEALPQIYVSGQATQWANIDATGTKNIPFIGALTEHAACGQNPTPPCQSFTPTDGWTALHTGLARIGVTPGSVATDLRIDE